MSMGRSDAHDKGLVMPSTFGYVSRISCRASETRPVDSGSYTSFHLLSMLSSWQVAMSWTDLSRLGYFLRVYVFFAGLIICFCVLGAGCF
jgi:hypothetical protein